MPQSHARIVVHTTFSTKNRTPFLKSPEARTRLHAYMAVVLQNFHCEPILVNGTEDHVHILANLGKVRSIADLIEEVKTTTSKWAKRELPNMSDFYWQAGYGAFSVSESNVEQVRHYIAEQEEHHRRHTFQDEFRALCKKHGLEIDERYVWD
jgi:REP element-mobilizing transposase RayT